MPPVEQSLVLPSSGGEPLLVEAYVVEQLRLWKDPLRAWEGEITLTFSGTAVGLVRHRRRMDASNPAVSGDIRFGTLEVLFEEWRAQTVFESWTVRPPRP